MQLIRVGLPRRKDTEDALREILNYPYGRFFVRTNNTLNGAPEVYFDSTEPAFENGYIDLYVADRYAQMTVDRLASGTLWGRIIGVGDAEAEVEA